MIRNLKKLYIFFFAVIPIFTTANAAHAQSETNFAHNKKEQNILGNYLASHVAGLNLDFKKRQKFLAKAYKVNPYNSFIKQDILRNSIIVESWDTMLNVANKISYSGDFEIAYSSASEELLAIDSLSKFLPEKAMMHIRKSEENAKLLSKPVSISTFLLKSWVLAFQGKFDEAIFNLKSPTNFIAKNMNIFASTILSNELLLLKAFEKPIPQKLLRSIELDGNLNTPFVNLKNKTFLEYLSISFYINNKLINSAISNSKKQLSKDVIDMSGITTSIFAWKSPSISESNIWKAQIYANIKQYDKVEALLTNIGQNSQYYTQAQILIGDINIQKGLWANTFSSLKRVMSFEVKTAKEQIIIGEKLAQMLLYAKSYKDAKNFYNVLLKTFPSNENRWKWILQIAMINEETNSPWKETEKMLRESIKIKESYSALNALAYGLAVRKINLNEAKSLIEKSLKKDFYNAALLDTMGWVLFQKGETKNAILFLSLAASQDADNSVIIDHLAQAFEKIGKPRLALYQLKNLNKSNLEKEELERINEYISKLSKKL